MLHQFQYLVIRIKCNKNICFYLPYFCSQIFFLIIINRYNSINKWKSFYYLDLVRQMDSELFDSKIVTIDKIPYGKLNHNKIVAFLDANSIYNYVVISWINTYTLFTQVTCYMAWPCACSNIKSAFIY